MVLVPVLAEARLELDEHDGRPEPGGPPRARRRERPCPGPGGDRRRRQVGLGPREAFERLPRSRTIPLLAGDDVWVVNCFVVAKAARRSGVAGALLDAAVTYAAEHGAVILEGYPVDTRGTRISSASVYTGTAGMFRRAGFEVAAPTTSKAASGTPRLVMRRAP